MRGVLTLISARITPSQHLDENVVTVMEEIGISLDEQFPKPLADDVVQAADVVITMSCGDTCPIYPGKRYEDWTISDPAALDLEGIRSVRDALRTRVMELADGLVTLP